MLRYRRNTALQGVLVLAKSGRLELGNNILTDIICLSSTTMTQSACKAIEFGEKKQNKGNYAAQGDRGRYQSKARMRLPISD